MEGTAESSQVPPVPPAAQSAPVTGPVLRSTGAVAAVVLVVVVVVFVGLWAAGVIPFHSSSSSSATPVGFSQASTSALSAASSQWPATGWGVIGALAYNLPHGGTVQTVALLPQCALVPVSGASTATMAVPAIQGSAGVGTSTAWAFLLRNVTGTVALVTVVNGASHLSGTLSGAGCTSFGWYHRMPGGVIDSSAAVTAANLAGGSSFLGLYPDANASMVVTGGFTGPMFPAPPATSEWEVVYSDCPLGSATTTLGHGFLAMLNGTSGTLLSSVTVSGTCAAHALTPLPPTAPTQLQDIVTLGTPHVSQVGATWYYNLSMTITGAAPSAGSLGIEVQTVAGAQVPVSGSLSILTSESPLATYDLSSGVWTSGAGTVLWGNFSLSMSLTAPSSGISGDNLVMLGSGYFTGSCSIAIP